MVASGYPRAVVPNVLQTNVAAAETQLRAKHLRFRIEYSLAPRASANQVLGQWPAAGASVYQGTWVRLTVARPSHWVKVFADSGTRGYQSDPFTVPKRWRIRYRLSAGDLGFALAQISWSANGDPFGGSGFRAYNSDGLRTYVVPTPGTYRLSVSPYLGASWYVEVDAYR
jgi:hypothetical protein